MSLKTPAFYSFLVTELICLQKEAKDHDSHSIYQWDPELPDESST